MSKVIHTAVATALVATIGCAGGQTDTRSAIEAKQAIYASSYGAIFRATFEAVSGEYDKTAGNPRARLIQTPWHQLPLTEHVTTKEDTPRQVSELNESDGEDEGRFFQRRERRRAATDRTTRFFIRFDVQLQQVGGAPGAADARWKVVIAGHAQKWDGSARPEPLTGAETPYWLEKRVDKLRVAIHDKLAKLAVAPGGAPATAPAPEAAAASAASEPAPQ